VYKYLAYDAQRKVVKGTLDVTSEGLAKQTLERSGFQVLSLKPIRRGLSLRSQIPTLFGVKAHDVIAFSRLLATLVERGTNTLGALELLMQETRNPTFRMVIHAVSEDLRQGSALSEAIAKHPEAFPDIYCRMIKVSEGTGNLEGGLRQLADYMEKEQALLSKVGRAFVYPAFVLLIAAGVITLMMLVTLPSLTGLFAEFEGQLPLPTRLLVALTTFVNTYILYLLGLILGVVVLSAWSVRKPKVQRTLDILWLKMPMIGPIVALREMSHFSRMVSTGLRASLPMPEIMSMAVQTSRNKIVGEALKKVSGSIQEGRGFSHPLSEDPVFPPLLVQMVAVGEEAGTLDDDLAAIAEIYDAEVDKRVDTIVSLLEPGLMVVLGLIVAFVVMAVILPTFSILGEIE